MTRRVRQSKPIKFGDGPDPGTVEGHRNKMIEAAETRSYNRRMKELAAEDEARREGLLSKVFGFIFSRSGKYLFLAPDGSNLPSELARKPTQGQLENFFGPMSRATTRHG
jgi:hypothetical protein